MGADLYIKDMPREAQHTGFRTSPKVGYFRDAYNDSNLLWKMEESYWEMDGKYPDWFCKSDDGEELTVEGCQGLLALVKSKKGMLADDDEDAQGQFESLVKVLEKAIGINSPIVWSV